MSANAEDLDAGFREPLRLFTSQLTSISNSVYTRAQLMQDWIDPRRDINKECGYDNTTSLADRYDEMYRRESIARRVVRALPRESWKVHPIIYESEDPDKITNFEEDMLKIGDNLRGEQSYYRGDEGNPLMEYFYRADVECGKGRYGVLFLGLDDNGPLDQEVTSAKNLVYLRCFDEKCAVIKSLETRPGPRFGHPLTYELFFNDPKSFNQDLASLNGKAKNSLLVHHSRVIHIADNLGGSEILGTPRMEPVWNRLCDLRKLYGGSAEMYWKGGFGGFSFETPPGVDPREVKLNLDNMKDNVEEFMNGLQKFIVLVGLNAKSLAPQVVDPTPQITIQLQAIAMDLEMPMRVLMGSERGQLATMGDREEWNERLRARQSMFITPRILVAFTDRMIKLGVVRTPEKPKRSKFVQKATRGLGQAFKSSGGYTIFWPDMKAQTSAEKANNAFKLAQALAVYAEKSVQWIFPPRPFLSSIIGLTEQEARNVEALSEEYNKEHGHIPGQDPTQPTDPNAATATNQPVVSGNRTATSPTTLKTSSGTPFSLSVKE